MHSEKSYKITEKNDEDQMAMDIESSSDPAALEDDEWEGIDDGDTAMDEDDDDTPVFFKELNAAKDAATMAKTQPKRPKTKVAAVGREKVRKVLEDTTGIAQKRSRMLDQNDFLKLLIAFNEEGIHFSKKGQMKGSFCWHIWSAMIWKLKLLAS